MKIRFSKKLIFIGWIGLTNLLFAQNRIISRFPIGEELTYSAWLNFMKVGYSTITIKAIESVDGFPVYHVESITKTSPFYGKIYRVNDRFNSWIDLDGLFSRRYEKSLREGKYKKDYQAYFDYNEKKAYTSLDTLDIDGRMHDALSVIFWVRAEYLFPGRIIRLNNFDNNKLRLFNVIVSGVETLKVPAGEFQCFVLEPYSDDGKLFKNQNKMTIYLSNDSLRLPVMIDNEANFGRMIFKLENRTVHQ